MTKQPQTCYVATKKETSFHLHKVRGIHSLSYGSLDKIDSVYIHTPEELEALKAKFIWDKLYAPCESCGGGHIRPCQHCGDLGFHKVMFEWEEVQALKAEWQREAAEKAVDKGIGIGRRALIGAPYYPSDENYIKEETESYLDQHYPKPQPLNTNV